MRNFGNTFTTDYHLLVCVICWQLKFQLLDRILRRLYQTNMAFFAHNLDFTLKTIMELDSFLRALLFIIILLGSHYICLLCRCYASYRWF